jgi:hypothetical protein
VRKKLQAKYIELETRKDGMKFSNRQLRVAAERLQALSSEYDGRQAQLVAQVRGLPLPLHTYIWLLYNSHVQKNNAGHPGGVHLL